MQTENTYVETDLGNIALNPRGEYLDEASYEYLDIVSYKGGSYMCLAELTKTVSGIAPVQSKNTEHWQMLTLPGGLTSDYITMHDDVVNKAKQVETSRAAAELSQQEVEAAQADVSQMRQDTQEAAEEAASSRDSAAGYAQSAEASRTAAKESEDNINAQVVGFDAHVAEKTSAAEISITEARRAAVSAVSTKQDNATQAVTDEGNKQIKNVEDAGTEQVGKAKSAGASAVSAADAAGVSAVNAVKTQQTASIKAVADEGTQQVTAVNTAGSTQASIIETKGADQVKAIQEAGENALQNISDGVDKGLSEEGKAADAKATGEAISNLTEDTTALQKRQNVLVGSETGNPVNCDDAFAAPLCGLYVYGRSTQDGMPNVDNPVPIVSAGDGGSVAVKVMGKNLFPVITNANLSKINKPDGGTRYGYVFHVPVESSVTISGNADIHVNCFVGDFDIKTQTYTQKAQLISEEGGTFATTLQSGWYVVYMANDYLPTILTKLNDAKVQIEIGAEATAYEPYREQLLALSTPNGLPGIPVASGGNYTDPQGQQWVCDEVDLERGVKVQRVKSVDISSLDKSFWVFRKDIDANVSATRYSNKAVIIDFRASAPAMSNILPAGVGNDVNTFRLVATPLYLYQFNLDSSKFPTVESWVEYLKANTVLIIYAPATPIETPLTPAEIAAYKAITAYAPDTVVQASDGAGIKLDYQRDVNLVVKNLEDAIASMTTT